MLTREGSIKNELSYFSFKVSVAKEFQVWLSSHCEQLALTNVTCRGSMLLWLVIKSLFYTREQPSNEQQAMKQRMVVNCTPCSSVRDASTVFTARTTELK